MGEDDGGGSVAKCELAEHRAQVDPDCGLTDEARRHEPLWPRAAASWPRDRWTGRSRRPAHKGRHRSVDPEPFRIGVDERHYFGGSRSNSRAKKLDAALRISFAQRRSLFSFSSAFIRSRSSLLSPGRRPFIHRSSADPVANPLRRRANDLPTLATRRTQPNPKRTESSCAE